MKQNPPFCSKTYFEGQCLYIIKYSQLERSTHNFILTLDFLNRAAVIKRSLVSSLLNSLMKNLVNSLVNSLVNNLVNSLVNDLVSSLVNDLVSSLVSCLGSYKEPLEKNLADQLQYPHCGSIVGPKYMEDYMEDCLH